jgi:CopA family copper-resistance protein
MSKKHPQPQLSRREFLASMGAAAFVSGVQLALPLPAWARTPGFAGTLDAQGTRDIAARNRYDIEIAYAPIMIDGRGDTATALNGSLPGPLIKLREGERVRLNVTNRLMDVDHASIHWHGLLVPFRMDGVPGINFNGIQPGETYEYEFDVKQAGTYWYHSHSAFQEQTGTYGPLIIEPRQGEPFNCDREFVVVLSEWSFESPDEIFRNIHMVEGYYNFQKRTISDLFENMRERGAKPALADWLAWDKMRMSPVDLLGVTGATYTYLMNGNSPAMNWTGLFNPGETIRLRFVNASAMTQFDVRIPGLNMEVVMADGKAVKPVDVHEFRIGVAETYDVLIRPQEDKAFTIFAEALDRSGYTRGTLAPEPGLEAPVPGLRKRPVRNLDDIGMGMMDDMIFGGGMEHMDMSRPPAHQPKQQDPDVPGPNGPTPFKPDKGDSAVVMVVKHPRYRLNEPGIGLGDDGWKVLTYADLVSDEPQPYPPEVDREMTINITANMERYMFSFDGKKFTEHPGPYLFRYNERLRLFLVNHTMMEHPIHLHGMWMQLENGQEHGKIPFKHTILVKPGEKVSALITPIEKGDWAFHCHLLYHMEAGMFQVVRVA